jgi:hypothetical protein
VFEQIKAERIDKSRNGCCRPMVLEEEASSPVEVFIINKLNVFGEMLIDG